VPTAIPLNGTRLNIRLIEVELSKLRLDPDIPRLHSAYLTHELSSRTQGGAIRLRMSPKRAETRAIDVKQTIEKRMSRKVEQNG
jgi:hypothetical protein